MKPILLPASLTVVITTVIAWRHMTLRDEQAKLQSLQRVAAESAVAAPHKTTPKPPAQAEKNPASPAYLTAWGQIEALAALPPNEWRPIDIKGLTTAEQEELLQRIIASDWPPMLKMPMAKMLVGPPITAERLLTYMNFCTSMLEKYPGQGAQLFPKEALPAMLSHQSGATLVQGQWIQDWWKANGRRLEKHAPEQYEILNKMILSATPASFINALAQAEESAIPRLVQERIAPVGDLKICSDFIKESQKLADANLRKKTHDAIAEQLGKNFSLEQLKTFLGDLSLPAETLQGYRVAAAAADFGKTPADRIAWAMEAAGTPELRAESMAMLTSAWAKQNINAAGTWLSTQPKGPERDAATSAFAREIFHTEPPSAVDWSMTIENASQRQSMLQELYLTWKTKDATAATAYFQSKGVKVP